jgi:hypothetical protein
VSDKKTFLDDLALATARFHELTAADPTISERGNRDAR